MLRELLEAWRAKDMLSRMYEELLQMLESDRWMFDSACEVVFGGKPADAVSSQLYDRDIAVNKTERTIRKQIVEHLSINPGSSMPACLTLMSIVKDAERIGDYCKNLFELHRLAGGPIKGDGYSEDFSELVSGINSAFDSVGKALSECDAKLGHDIIERMFEMSNRCEKLFFRLAGDSLTCRQAVSYTLAVRYLKRVSAHLKNLATSLVMPIHKLDYFDEKWKR